MKNDKGSILTKRKKIGYAFGIFGDSLYYNMFYTYYLTFLNEIVGLKPAYSSIIIFISILWDGVTDPMIGSYTDRAGVDKKRVMRRSAVPLGLVFILAWTSLGGMFSAQWMKILFYTIISMCLWLFYTLYTIPYYAVIPEMTDDYDERTSIRSTSSLVNSIAVALGNMLPALVPTVAIVLTRKFQSESYAVIAAVISILAVVTSFVCCKSLDGVYNVKPRVEGQQNPKVKDTFKGFLGILKMRPARFFMAFVFLFLCGQSMLQSSITYTVIDCIGLDYGTGTAIYIVVLAISMALTVPFVEKLSKKTDRRTACISFLSVVVVGLVAMRIIGLGVTIGSFPVMIVFVPLFCGVAMGTFWTLFYSMAYDLVELDEFKTGTRKESMITALPQLVQKFGSAVGILLNGQLLSLYGYDTSLDPAGKEELITRVTDTKIVSGMSNIGTIFPAILVGLSVVFLIAYPMTRKRFDALVVQLENKKNNKTVDTKEIEVLLK